MEIQLFFNILIFPSVVLKLWNVPDNFDFKGKIVTKLLLRKHFLSIYDKKTALTMGTFKKYVTWTMIFFIPFSCVTLCKLYFRTSPVLLKISNYGMRKTNIFCLYGCLSISYYMSKEEENFIKLLQNQIFRHTCLCKQHNLIK